MSGEQATRITHVIFDLDGLLLGEATEAAGAEPAACLVRR